MSLRERAKSLRQLITPIPFNPTCRFCIMSEARTRRHVRRHKGAAGGRARRRSVLAMGAAIPPSLKNCKAHG